MHLSHLHVAININAYFDSLLLHIIYKTNRKVCIFISVIKKHNMNDYIKLNRQQLIKQKNSKFI